LQTEKELAHGNSSKSFKEETAYHLGQSMENLFVLRTQEQVSSSLAETTQIFGKHSLWNIFDPNKLLSLKSISKAIK
jgi:hypothetical protein